MVCYKTQKAQRLFQVDLPTTFSTAALFGSLNQNLVYLQLYLFTFAIWSHFLFAFKRAQQLKIASMVLSIGLALTAILAYRFQQGREVAPV